MTPRKKKRNEPADAAEPDATSTPDTEATPEGSAEAVGEAVAPSSDGAAAVEEASEAAAPVAPPPAAADPPEPEPPFESAPKPKAAATPKAAPGTKAAARPKAAPGPRAAAAAAKKVPPAAPRLSKEARDQAEAAQGRSRLVKASWIFAGLGLVLGVAAGVAWFATRDSGSGGGTQVGVQGDELPGLPTAGGADPAAGQAVPAIVGRALDGSPMTIGPDGKPKVVVFLAHWCPHCQAEVPRLQDWIDARGVPPDVELRAVATASDSARPNFPADAWLTKEGWTVLTMLDNASNQAAKAYGVSSFPFFVVIDAQGNVVTRESGEVTVQRWEELLESARTGTAVSGAGGPSSPAA